MAARRVTTHVGDVITVSADVTCFVASIDTGLGLKVLCSSQAFIPSLVAAFGMASVQIDAGWKSDEIWSIQAPVDLLILCTINVLL